ncbi:hypothetical protein Aduo_003622 [Ancylostoma duodenale]
MVELAHDGSTGLYKGDHAIYNFFFRNRKVLSNSFIFFFGDHGPRFGKEAGTSFGHSELNNPFLYVIVPKILRNTELAQQLRQNSKELVTHFDIHATLEDVLYFQPASNFTELEFEPFGKKRSSSLLRRFEAGKPRNCKTLPIPFQYCICQFDKKQVTDKALKEMLGRFVVEQLNSFLKTQNISSQCEENKLHKVDVEQYLSEKVKGADNTPSFFEVTFEVAAPAKGKFQIPVRKELEQLDLGGALFTRLDKYGKNGDCMKNDALKPFCTCKKK